MKINHYASSQEKKRVEVEMAVILSWETRATFVTENGASLPTGYPRCGAGGFNTDV